jgi:hypothetical protein
MGKLPPHVESDLAFFTSLLRWTDSVSIGLAVMVILLLLFWWPA